MTPRPTLEEFKASARQYLASVAPLRQADGLFEWGRGADDCSLFEDAPTTSEIAEACQWRRTIFDAGFGAITVPAKYGGRELPAAYDHAYNSEERRFQTPRNRAFHIGLGMVAPTLLAHGTDAAKDLYVRAMYRGELIGCQLFSEPGAGSDLAGVTTRAKRVDGGWVVSGQKVWTSVAQHAHLGLLLARTSAEPRHHNLTAFLLNMDQEGVKVRPLRQMTGGSGFNEVFIDDAWIPDSQRLGAVDEGWRVALTTLMFERSAVGSPAAGGAGILSQARLLAMVEHFGAAGDPLIRDELVSVLSHLNVAKYNRLRFEAERMSGRPPGPEASIGKLALTANLQRVSALVGRVLGSRLQADTGEWGSFAWAQFILGAPGLRLGGGTDEVLRNVLAERVLGLPKDPAPVLGH